MNNNVKWLYRQIPDLVSNGVITEQNAEQIRQYYGRMADAGKKRTALIVCSVIGFLLIALGIVSLIAHNWDQLGRAVRAVLSMLPSLLGIGLTFFALSQKKANPGLKEGSAAFLSLMIGASLALVCQTYNIAGDTRDFVLTWMVLSLPLVYIAEATVPAVICVIGITVWGAWSAWENTTQSFLYWLFIAALIPHFLMVLRDKSYPVRALLLSTFLTISVFVVTLNLFSRIFPGIWMVTYPLTCAVVYLLGVCSFKVSLNSWQEPLRKLGATGLVVVSFLLTYKWPWAQNDWWSISWMQGDYSAAGYAMIFILICAMVVLGFLVVKQKREEALLGAAPAVAIIGLAMRPLAMPLFTLYFLGLSLQHIMTGVRRARLVTINSGLLMLAFLIGGKFFDSEINFVIKGLVMIGLGIAFLVVNVMFARRKGGA